MLKKIKPKSDFSLDVLTLMTGTTIAQAIPIAISPLLTRIYAPEDFGVYSIFIAITSILGSLATGRYELAIVLPEKEEDAINLLALSIIITTMVSLFLSIMILFFKDQLFLYLGNDNLKEWIFIVPVSIFLTGFYNALNYYNVRNKKYKDISNAVIIKAVSISSIQLSLGLLKSGAAGLITGQLVSQFFGNSALIRNLLADKGQLSTISKNKITKLALKYKKFPQFSLWAGLLNSLSVHLTNILISSYFSIATLGLYAFVQRILGTPSALIGNSFGQVFLQAATKEKQESGKAINTFKLMFKKLIIIGLPTFIILFIVVEDLFALIFGEPWRLAGEYAQILSVLFAVTFISSPFSMIMTVFEKQKQALLINTILLFSSIGILLISFQLGLNFKEFLVIFTVVMSVDYLMFLYYYFRLAKGIE